MTIELKIKNKHLSEEARIIRFEEQKLKKQLRSDISYHISQGHNGKFNCWDSRAYRDYYSLNNHRRWDVRNENRATFLARAFIEGKPYKSVESWRKPENEYTFSVFIIPRVLAMVNKYGDKSVTKDLIVLWSKL